MKNLKLTKVAMALMGSALLFGCGSSDNSSNDNPSNGGDDGGGDANGGAVLLIDDSNSDAPYLRFNVDNEVRAAGTLSVDIKVDSADEKLSYVTLFGSSTSTSNAILDLKMGGENSDYSNDVSTDEMAIKLRAVDASGNKIDDIDTQIIYPGNEWVNATLAWDSAAGTVDITVKNMEGVEIGQYSADMQTKLDVEKIQFKIGDTGGVTTTSAPYYVDNIALADAAGEVLWLDEFSSGSLDAKYTTAGNVTVVGEGDDNELDPDPDTNPDPDPDNDTPVNDDFDSYTNGQQIDSVNSAYVIKDVGAESGTLAVISNEQAVSGAQSLYLEDNSTSAKPIVSRLFDADKVTEKVNESGSVSVSVYIPSDTTTFPDDGSNSKATYIYLGTATSASSSTRFTELVFTSSKIRFRDEGASQVDLIEYSKDTWVDVEIKWQGEDITLVIDGTEFTQTPEGLPLKAENDTGAPTLVSLYTGDTSGKARAYFDNLQSSLF